MPANRLRFELLLAAACVAFGALLLPGLVYGVGVLLLGTYADGGLASFYGNLYRDLVGGSLSAASLIVGPYLIVNIARLPLIGRRRGTRDLSDPPASETPSARRNRVEPRIGH